MRTLVQNGPRSSFFLFLGRRGDIEAIEEIDAIEGIEAIERIEGIERIEAIVGLERSLLDV